jgi:hypothetical protein
VHRKKKSAFPISKVYLDPEELSVVHFVDESKRTVHPLDIMLMVPHAASTVEQKEMFDDFMEKLAAVRDGAEHEFMVEHFEDICKTLHDDDVQHHPGGLVVQESKSCSWI